LLAFIQLFSFFSAPADEPPVRATLADGQVLMGEVHTRVLRLATGAGWFDRQALESAKAAQGESYRPRLGPSRRRPIDAPRFRVPDPLAQAGIGR
jgi:hypothetical protein